MFNSTDRTWTAWSSVLEDHKCGDSDCPLVETEIVRDQPYQLNVHRSMGPEGASGCHGRTPLDHLSKILGGPC